MPGIDTDIVQHCIPADLTMKPVKQKLRRIKLEWTFEIKEEVEKQYNAGFLRVVNYPEWLANVVSIAKKDGKVRMCIDFRDLNKASPKDDFLCLTLTSWLTTQHGMLCSRLWVDFQDTIRLRWLQKIWRRLPSLHHGGHIAIRSCHLALKMLVLLTNE